MYEIQMLGILDHNLTTVTVPMLDGEDRAIRDSMSTEDRKVVHDDFDATIFGGKSDSLTIADTASVEGMENSLSVPASYASARLLAHKLEDRRALSPSSSIDIPGQNAGLSSGLGVAGVKLSPDTGVVDSPAFERLNIQRTSLRSVSPVPSALSLGRSAREISPSRSSEISVDASSGNSTPRETPVRRLKIQGSKGSLASRFGTRWLFSALGQRSQPSFPAAAAETVGRHDVISTASGLPGSPAQSNGRTSQSLPLSGALVITPSSPSPAKQTKDTNITQPVPIASRATRMMSHEDLSKSHRGSVRLSGSPVASSWGKVNTFNRDKTHVSLNPCNPKENIDTSFGEGRRWQHVRPKATNDSQHLVKWASLCAPACLPLTTDFMPTPSEIQEFYEFHPYSIACYPNQVSFLVRPDAAQVNLPLAVMREMASQRLSREYSPQLFVHADRCRELSIYCSAS